MTTVSFAFIEALRGGFILAGGENRRLASGHAGIKAHLYLKLAMTFYMQSGVKQAYSRTLRTDRDSGSRPPEP